MRAFVAVDVPASVKDKVEDLECGIDFPGMVFVKREAMHLTLLFLGEVSEEDVEKAKAALSEVSFLPFTISLKGVSYFSPDFIKVVFVEVREGSSELLDLRKRICGAMSGKGIGLKEEDFTPHLTVARVKRVKDRQVLIGALAERAQTDFGSFEVNSIILKKSVLGEKGPMYTDLLELKAGTHA